ncbi:MAG: hypothetical protein J6V52_03965, partial [Bacteroidaceae bacterium]|nr:hypothetical protein [Bacteroidaceae bacterium]
MKKMFLGMSLALLAACGQNAKTEVIDGTSMAQVAVFTSADKNLEKTYNWAKAMAWLYAHEGGDPVGYWYEAS